MSRTNDAGSRVSPQRSLWSPRSHRSPRRVTVGSLSPSSGSRSAGSSFAFLLSPSMIRSISAVAKPVTSRSEAGLDRAEMLKLDLQDLRVPAGILGDLVVSQNVGLELLVGQMIDLDGRHFGPAERPRGFDSAMTREDRGEIVDDDGIDEA